MLECGMINVTALIMTQYSLLKSNKGIEELNN